jgi:hypothetical protein
MHVNFERFDALEFRSCGPIDVPFGESTSDLDGRQVVGEELTSNELAVLLLLASEAFSKNSQAELSFQGIKAKLNLHQQKLTKALERLTQKNLIDKTLNGYRLSKDAMKIVNSFLTSVGSNPNPDPKESIGFEVKIPLSSKNNELFKLVYLLKGRWFANWRWIGMFQDQASLKMEWQSISGELEACLCINENRLCIALFDKNSSPPTVKLDLLKFEFDKFLEKVQKIMNIDLTTYQSLSTTMIKTNSNCNRRAMSNWLSGYA